MFDEEPVVARRRRTRSATVTARSEALERLKARRFQIKIQQPIYVTMGEDEYEALVAKRREEATGFIVDDSGLRYGDDGHEEDWSVAGGSLSSEESEGESERSKKKKKGSNSENKEKETAKKPSALASAAALMGKQRISSMFTSSVFKKDIQKNVPCDSIVDDVIAEFALNENDRERKRRANSRNLGLNKPNNFASSAIGVLPVKIEKPVVSSYNLDVKNDIHETNNGGVDHSEKDDNILDGGNSTIVAEEGPNAADMIRNVGTKENNKAVNNEKNDFLLSKSEGKEVEKKVFSLNAKIGEAKDPVLSASVGWQAVSAGIVDCKGSVPGPGENQATSSDEKLDFEVESYGSLPFYILDAHEEIYGANAANLYLFGKLSSSLEP